MRLTLADDEGTVVDQWEINQDIDLADLEELTDCLYEAGFYTEEQMSFMKKD